MLQKTTEHHGVGQSGYTAGRGEKDPSLDLQIQTQPEVVREDPTTDQHDDTDIESDDRWSGRGGEIAKPEPE